MKQAILYSFLSSLLSFLPIGQAIAENNDSIRFSLLTCTPGEEIYELFGHTAIRYENKYKGIDVVFNYGLFSFNTPNFIFRFALGEADYQFGATEYPSFALEYKRFGRGIRQQTLNLSPEEKAKLIGLLEENYRPENRVYRYNFFYDNCATRPRDKIEESIMGKVIYPMEPLDGSHSFRDIVHEYCKGHPWASFGIDFCVGSKADRPITRRQMMFAPYYLMNAFDGALISNDSIQRPLVTATRQVVNITPLPDDSPWLPTPKQCSYILFFLIAAATIYGLRHRKSLWVIDLILFALAGITGCVLAFLSIFSQHPAVNHNYLVFVFHPGHLLLLPYIIYYVRKKQRCAYLTVNLVLLTFFIMLYPLIPQKIDEAIVPLTLCLWLRSISNWLLGTNVTLKMKLETEKRVPKEKLSKKE